MIVFFILRPGCHQQKLEQCMISHPNMFNLPGKPFSKNRTKPLRKGLKFAPTPIPNMLKIKRSLEDLKRN